MDELNERVAVEVMGYQFGSLTGVCINKWWRRLPDGYLDVRYQGLPDYRRNIEDAWLIVDELGKRLIWLATLEEQTPVAWFASFRYWMPEDDDYEAHWVSCGSGFCKIAPLAICYAALNICAKLRSMT